MFLNVSAALFGSKLELGCLRGAEVIFALSSVLRIIVCFPPPPPYLELIKYTKAYH